LVQGIVVRQRTPRLPEPPGPRQGTTGSGKLLRLLIIGDSAGAGVGVAHQDEALSGQLVSRLAEHFQVDWRLDAETGATTQATLDKVRGFPDCTFDVAVTSLGVNDVTSRVALDHWLTLQRALWDELRTRFGVRLIVVSGLPPLHGFPALPRPLRQYLGDHAGLLDKALEQELEKHAGIDFLSVRFTENTDEMASDGFHPGPAIYAEWARRAAELITRLHR
jgi:lysophospholipase L1-like esterase